MEDAEELKVAMVRLVSESDYKVTRKLLRVCGKSILLSDKGMLENKKTNLRIRKIRDIIVIDWPNYSVIRGKLETPFLNRSKHSLQMHFTRISFSGTSSKISCGNVSWLHQQLPSDLSLP
jgi:hypothetical protein